MPKKTIEEFGAEVKAIMEPTSKIHALTRAKIGVVGQRYRIGGEDYILAQVDACTFNFISLRTGNRRTSSEESFITNSQYTYMAYLPKLFGEGRPAPVEPYKV